MNKYFVVGSQTSKSLSPIIFNYWFKKYSIKANYGFLELNNKNFDKKLVEIFKNKSVKGLNITIPFKQKIIKHIDVLDTHSQKINAVNCVQINKRIKGVNTDWAGYYKTLPKKRSLKKNKVLLIGYGGAALAIHYVLKTKGFKDISVINRTKKKLMFENKTKYTIGINRLDKYLGCADLIINTTPTNPIKNKDKKRVNTKSILSDIVYSPKETEFLKNFPNNKKIYGITMLVEQARLCFKLWFGFMPSPDLKLIAMLDKKIK